MMVVGNGLIANSYIQASTQRPSILIFASGVSNSTETNPSAFSRELELLKKYADKDRTITYFSTVSIYDPTLQNSLYIKHKKNMEQWLENETRSFIIFRLSNVVGHSPNPYTLFNFLVQKISSGEHFNLHTNACRNFLDIDDLFPLTSPFFQPTRLRLHVNIPGSVSIKVPDLVSKIESRLNRKAKYTLIDSGACYDIPSTELAPVFVPRKNYLDELVEKYIP